ncbi:hypothetical protein VTK26DRAFT_5171 [Humicola hyalothermophila]
MVQKGSEATAALGVSVRQKPLRKLNNPAEEIARWHALFILRSDSRETTFLSRLTVLLWSGIPSKSPARPSIKPKWNTAEVRPSQPSFEQTREPLMNSTCRITKDHKHEATSCARSLPAPTSGLFTESALRKQPRFHKLAFLFSR